MDGNLSWLIISCDLCDLTWIRFPIAFPFCSLFSLSTQSGARSRRKRRRGTSWRRRRMRRRIRRITEQPQPFSFTNVGRGCHHDHPMRDSTIAGLSNSFGCSTRESHFRVSLFPLLWVLFSFSLSSSFFLSVALSVWSHAPLSLTTITTHSWLSWIQIHVLRYDPSWVCGSAHACLMCSMVPRSSMDNRRTDGDLKTKWW